MNHFTKLLALACAGALAVSMAGCSFFKGDEADSASASASNSTAATFSAYGAVENFDYETFDYSNGLDENGYWSGIHALDYVTLPEDYAALAVDRAKVEPTADDVQEEIEYLLQQNATTAEITNRRCATGDTVNIDYTGTVNGVAFTGGTAEGYALTLGSGTFIDGFEDQVAGHIPGETFDITVTFPEGYNDSTDAEGNVVPLSGAEAVFTVTLNFISETQLPTLDDDWVAGNFSTNYSLNTVDELRAYMNDMLYTSNLNVQVMNTLMELATFRELPKSITDYQVNQCLNYYYTMANAYGYSLEDFVQMLGYDTPDAMLASMDEDIAKYSREALLYQAVAEAMELEPTQAQIDNYAGYTASYGANYCRMVALMDAVTEALTKNAVVK